MIRSVFLRNGPSAEMNVNGQGGPVEFVAGPAAGERWLVDGIRITLADVPIIVGDLFGAVPTLANGLLLDVVREASPLVDLLDGDPIKRTRELVSMGTLTSAWNDAAPTNPDIVGVVIPLNPSGDGPLELLGDRQDQIRMTVQDNLGTVRMLRAELIAAQK